MTKDELVDALGRAGKAVETFISPEGSTALILPHGGRILALYAPNSSENFFWTNSLLSAKGNAKDFFSTDQWHNSGGDRTWLAPEVNFFFPNLPDMNTYRPPKQFDPGDYQVTKFSDKIQMVSRFYLPSFRSGNKLHLEISKTLTPAPNPIRDDREMKASDSVEYAGYTLTTSLKMLDERGKYEDQVGIWNLLQMPHKGELLIPTYSLTKPKVFFGEIPQEDISVDDHLVRYKMQAKGGQKIGIRAVATTGRIGYIYQSSDKWNLLIRNFLVNPSGQYIDMPWDDFQDRGYAVQACNVDTNLGSFSEMEYHTPAIGRGTGLYSCQDTSQTWAFRSTLKNIKSIAKKLLAPCH